MAGLTLDAGALIAFERNDRHSWPASGVRGTTDVIDASVVLCARDRNHRIATSDPDDIRLLDPSAHLILV